MPGPLPKKTVKRAVAKIDSTPLPPVAAPVVPEIKIVKNPSHHGLVVGYLIMIFLVIGCVSAAFLMSEKLKMAISYAGTADSQLAASELKKAELAEELSNIKTLQNLAAKAAAPAAVTVPADLVWSTYTSPNVSIQYPADYAVVKAVSAFPVLTIKGAAGRIEIFRMKDFPDGKRPFGFSRAEVTPTDLDQYIPKEFKTAAAADLKALPYSIWVYYAAGDEQAKAVLDQAVSTFKAIK